MPKLGRPTKIFDNLPHDFTKRKTQLGIALPTKYMDYLEENVLPYVAGADSVQDLLKLAIIERYPVFLNVEMKEAFVAKLKEEHEQYVKDNPEIDESEEEEKSKKNGRAKIDIDDIEPV